MISLEGVGGDGRGSRRFMNACYLTKPCDCDAGSGKYHALLSLSDAELGIIHPSIPIRL